MHQDNDFLTLPPSRPLWRELADGIRERISPPPEPELHLESKPIPVKDIWAPPPNPWRRAGSVAIHAAVIGILMLPIWKPVRAAIQPRKEIELIMPRLLAPGPSLPRMKKLAGGGAPIHKIAPPKLMPVNAPKLNFQPPVILTPTVAQANVPIPTFGDPGAIAGPPGKNMGFSGAGPGGAGNSVDGGGDCDSGPCTVGGDVSEPIPIYEPDPEYSDAARKAKYQGTVIVGVIIGADGRVYDPKIVQPLGLGLDQKAIEAVMKWRFEPARRHGKAVQVLADIEVNFHLY